MHLISLRISILLFTKIIKLIFKEDLIIFSVIHSFTYLVGFFFLWFFLLHLFFYFFYKCVKNKVVQKYWLVKRSLFFFFPWLAALWWDLFTIHHQPILNSICMNYNDKTKRQTEKHKYRQTALCIMFFHKHTEI